MFSNPSSEIQDGFVMSPCTSAYTAAGAWHLVSPAAQLRVTGDVRLPKAARFVGVASRDRIVVTAGTTFPGTPAWRPPT